MKKILLALLVFCFYINNSLASPISFKEKLEKFEKLLISRNYNPKQSQLILGMSLDGFTNCSQSSSQSGYICTFPEKLCIISQNPSGTSLKCLEEKDLDELLDS